MSYICSTISKANVRHVAQTLADENPRKVHLPVEGTAQEGMQQDWSGSGAECRLSIARKRIRTADSHRWRGTHDAGTPGARFICDTRVTPKYASRLVYWQPGRLTSRHRQGDQEASSENSQRFNRTSATYYPRQFFAGFASVGLRTHKIGKPANTLSQWCTCLRPLRAWKIRLLE